MASPPMANTIGTDSPGPAAPGNVAPETPDRPAITTARAASAALRSSRVGSETASRPPKQPHGTCGPNLRQARTDAAVKTSSSASAQMPAARGYPRTTSPATRASDAGTAQRANDSTPRGSPCAPRAWRQVRRLATFDSAAHPNVRARTAVANAAHPSSPTLASARASAATMTRTAPLAIDRRRADDEARRSTRRWESRCVRTLAAVTADSPRASPNGPTTIAPTSGSPEASAANDTATSVPCAR